MQLETKVEARRRVPKRLLQCVAALCLATCAAYGSPVVYSFTGTAPAQPGSPSHAEVFQLTLPDFLPVDLNGPPVQFVSTDPGVNSCVPCQPSPITALVFLRSASSDLVQFLDENGTTYPYFFPANTLTQVGYYQTLPGFNVNAGTLEVGAEAPEPSTMAFLAMGLGAVGLVRRIRGCKPAARQPRRGFIQ